MSLFIGKDNSNNALLHTTSGVNDISSMKSSVLTNTMFHTSLPYVQQVYIEDVSTYRNAWFNGYDYSYNFSAILSNTIIDYINQGYLFDIVISTNNSSHKRTSLDFASRFTKSGPPLSTVETYSTTQYSYGPNNNPWSWGTKSPTPSYTNRYILLENANLLLTNYILYGLNYSTPYTLDSIDNNTATIIVYNFSINGVLTNPSSISEVKINKNEFLISSNLGTIDLATFKPIRVISAPDSTSFVPMSSDINIKPYYTGVSTPVTWEINSSDSSNVFIKKTGTNGVSELIVGNGQKNLINYLVETVTYLVSTNKNEIVVDLNKVIPSNAYLGIFNSGNFNNGYYTNAITKGSTILINNSHQSTLVKGWTYRSSNGVEIYGDYYLIVFIETNRLKIKAYSKNGAAQPMDTGTFTGTLKLLYFNYL